MATSTNGGASFRGAVKVSDNSPGSVAELLPDVAFSGGRIVVVWQEMVNGTDDDRGRIKSARFTFFGRKLGADVPVDGGNDSSGKWRPAIAAAGRFAYVAWIDERDGSPEGIPFEHVYFARSRNGGREFEPARRIDVGNPVPLSAKLDNKWAPAVAAYRRNVLIAWSDFRNYNWDIFAVASSDRGETFLPNVRVDDFVPEIERLHHNPAVTIARRSGRNVKRKRGRRDDAYDLLRWYGSSLRPLSPSHAALSSDGSCGPHVHHSLDDGELVPGARLRAESTRLEIDTLSTRSSSGGKLRANSSGDMS